MSLYSDWVSRCQKHHQEVRVWTRTTGLKKDSVQYVQQFMALISSQMKESKQWVDSLSPIQRTTLKKLWRAELERLWNTIDPVVLPTRRKAPKIAAWKRGSQEFVDFRDGWFDARYLQALLQGNLTKEDLENIEALEKFALVKGWLP